MATPLLRALKRDYPNCEIYWLVDRYYAAALAGNPLIDEVISFDTGAWRRLMRRGDIVRYLSASLALRRRLSKLKLDVVLNLHADKWWAGWFNAAGERVGVFYTPTVGALGRFYTKTVAQTQNPKRLHNSEHYLQALRKIGIDPPYDLRLLYAVADADRREAEEFLERNHRTRRDSPLLLLHPGTSRLSKNWLPQQYAKLAQLHSDATIVITGSPAERGPALQIADLARCDNIAVAAGALSGFGATAALIELADVVVTGDTAVLHLASALGTPLVGIYGSTRPRSNAPLFGESELLYDDGVPCAPCYQPECPLQGDANMSCMKAITPVAVAAAIHRLLDPLRIAPGQNPGEKETHETTPI